MRCLPETAVSARKVGGSLGCLLAVLVACAPSTHAEAVLISADDGSFGSGALTQDTATGLEWLDVTGTAGLSIDDVLGGANGYLTAGFRYATRSEVLGLYTTIGFTEIDEFTSVRTGPEHFAAGLLAFSLLGQTGFDTGDNPLIAAVYFNDAIAEVARVRISLFHEGGPNAGAGVQIDTTGPTSTQRFSAVGHHLVRAFTPDPVQVDEPASLSLLLLGLVPLALRRSRPGLRRLRT